MTKLQEHLSDISACTGARHWARERTAAQAWSECTRPDWLLWWAAHTPANKHVDIVRAACDCARLVLYLIPPEEDRPRLAIEAAERWSHAPNSDNLSVAWAAALAAGTADAADAAGAAALAAWTAGTALAAFAAQKGMQQKCCDAIRSRLILPWSE